MTAATRDFSFERVRLAVLLILTATALGLGLMYRDRLSLEAVQSVVRSYGWWSPVAYLAMASVLPLAFVPRWLLTAVAGAVFGTVPGAALGLAGGLGGAVSGYALGRLLGSPYLEKHGGRRALAIRGFLRRNGFIAVALGRTNPAISCEAISLASGITVVPWRVYLAATVLGMAPGSLVYAALGDGIAMNETATTVGSLAVLLVLTSATGVWFWRAWKADTAKADRASASE
jgi:uncharacterized membrane protein YdjX (TVP38/TMEM64 family)